MPSVSCPSGGRRRQDAIAHSPIEPRRPPPAGFFFAFNHPARQRAQIFPVSALPRVSSPRRGEGGPKGRMRGCPLRISLPLPPHPAAATFSPSGRRRHAAPLTNQSPQTTANGALLSPYPPCGTDRRRDGKVMASTPAITQTSPTHMADVGTSPRNTMPMATPIGTLR